jgi:uncharacterized protein (TIGR02284 family)
MALGSDLVRMLNNLIELDFNAVEAYEAAIKHLKTTSDKEQLRKFMEDHRRHTEELSRVLEQNGNVPARKGSLGQIPMKGKILLARAGGDIDILYAMKKNEDKINVDYEEICSYTGFPEEVRQVLVSAFDDEKRHRSWLADRCIALERQHHEEKERLREDEMRDPH